MLAMENNDHLSFNYALEPNLMYFASECCHYWALLKPKPKSVMSNALFSGFSLEKVFEQP
jgi:hypothetical protein